MRIHHPVTLLVGLIAAWGASASLAVGQVTRPPMIALPTSNTGAIRGQVTDQATRRPLPSVQVTLRREGARPEVTLTNGDGRFQFRELGPGKYTLGFLKAGFVALLLGQRTALDDMMTIDLRDRQVIDNVAVALPPGCAIEGRVLDEAGFPVVEAKVSAMRASWIDGIRRLVPVGRVAITDDRGHYRVWGLSSGDYVVAAAIGSNQVTPSESDPGQATGFAATYYPYTEDPSTATRVTVNAGADAANVDITFHAVRLARLSGRVSTSSGRTGSSAVQLDLVRSSAGGTWLAQPMTVGVAQVSPTGTFTISGVSPGQYVLRARETAGSSVETATTTGQLSARASISSSEFAAVPVAVNGQDLGSIGLTTMPTGRLQGRVTLDGKPSAQSGMPPASIVAAPVAGEVSSLGLFGESVRKGHAFDFAGLTGRFVLRAVDLPTGVRLESVTIAGQDVTDSGIDVGAGQTVSEVLVQLTSQPARISGRVVAEGDADTEGTTVVVFSTEKDRWVLPSTRYVAATRVGREGRFQVDGLPPGPYLAIALAYVERGQWNDPDFLEAAGKFATRVTVNRGSEATVELRRQ